MAHAIDTSGVSASRLTTLDVLLGIGSSPAAHNESGVFIFPANRVALEIQRDSVASTEARRVVNYRIEPSMVATNLEVTTVVKPLLDDGPRSPGYIAVRRRQLAQPILQAITLLEESADREDPACTVPVVAAIRAALAFLAYAPTEGNAREVLRCLLDTFFHGGWRLYRSPAARIAAAVTAKRLLKDQVTPADANAAFDDLCDAGLTPLGISLMEIDVAESAKTPG